VSLGVSIFLLVVGAILTFAVDVTTSGFSINTVGIILMIAGALGLVLSLLFWSSFAPYRRDSRRCPWWDARAGLKIGMAARRRRLSLAPLSPRDSLTLEAV
jgi:hypothetical protein